MSGTRPDLRFPRTARIRARRDYLRIQDTGSHARGRHIILLYTANGLPISRFGITVSRKLGGAVVRNRIKRRLREIQRLNRHKVAPGYDIVLVARKPADQARFGDLHQEYLELSRTAGLLSGEGLT